MNRLAVNVGANVAGNVWTIVTSIAFIPAYIYFLGIEAYGLIGVFAALQSVLSLLDLGLTATFARETARHTASPEGRQLSVLFRTMEICLWATAALVSLLVWMLSSSIADEWINPNSLSREVAERAISLSGLAIALRFPLGLYSAGLIGAQRQVLLNGLKIAFESLKNIGVILVLWLVSPSIEMFFAFQASALLLYTFATRMAASRALRIRSTWGSVSELRRVWRFAAGMTGISATTAVLMQVDKVVLAKLLSLEQFGYYTVASTVATGIYQLIGPINTAFYPRITELVELNDRLELRRIFHLGSQVVATLAVPTAIFIAVFAKEVLLIWTGDRELAMAGSTVLSFLAAGMGLNAVMNMPYAIQLAHGWTSLPLIANLASIALLVPGVIFMTQRYGMAGAAVPWLFLNLGYVLVAAPVMFSRLLKSERQRWYISDVIVPVVACAVPAGCGRVALEVIGSQWSFAVLSCTFPIMLATAALASGEVRRMTVRFALRARHR